VIFIESFEHIRIYLKSQVLSLWGNRNNYWFLWVLGWIHGSWMVLGHGFNAL